jgi:DNA-binding transcriptional LysR family regulator
MVASGRFIATFPNSVARHYADRFSLKVPVDLPVRPWPVAILTLKNRTLSPVVERFIQHLRDSTRPTAAVKRAGTLPVAAQCALTISNCITRQ